jgi:hypothetical protein
MTAGTLWIEMTIAGSIYVVSLLFLAIGCWYPDLTLESFLSRFHGSLTYLGIAFIGLSYIFGFVVHRLMQIAISIGTHWRKLILRESPYFPAVKTEVEARLGDEETIWESSPPRIQREVDFQFAQLALLRSLALSVPCLFGSICIWRLNTGQYAVWQSTYWICFAAFYPLLIFAWRRQALQYKTILDGALKRVKAEKSVPPSSGPSEAIVTVKGIRLGEADGNCTVTFDGLKIDPPLVQISKLIPRLSPIYGPVGTDVTITGINFGKPQGQSSVTFNEAVGVPKTWESTHIVVPVPDGVLKKDAPTEGKSVITVKVLVQGGESGTNQNFTLQMTCPPFTVTQ